MVTIRMQPGGFILCRVVALCTCQYFARPGGGRGGGLTQGNLTS